MVFLPSILKNTGFVRTLDQFIELCCQPKRIRCNNCSEYVSSFLATRAISKGGVARFIVSANKSEPTT